MIYGIILSLVAIALVVNGSMSSKSGERLESGSLKLMHILGVLGAIGLCVSVGVRLIGFVYIEASLNNAVGFITTTISAVGLAYLIYYAFFRYSSEKQRANVAEYRLHLVKKALHRNRQLTIRVA